ncbi:MAG: hypothetical protein WCC48_07135 [Anaeromyxobacteraceae bacterium]
MTRALAIAAALAVATSARAEDPGEPGGPSGERANLVALAPPVAGYSSIDGVIWQAAPVSYERALFGHAGLRLSPTAVMYGRKLQGYGLVVGLPLYLRVSRAGAAYGGAYAAPLVAALVDLVPDERRTIRGGVEAGWAWSMGARWRLAAGVWTLFDTSGFEASAGGLTVALGLWL